MALIVLCSTDFFGDHPKGNRAKARNEAETHHNPDQAQTISPERITLGQRHRSQREKGQWPQRRPAFLVNHPTAHPDRAKQRSPNQEAQKAQTKVAASETKCDPDSQNRNEKDRKWIEHKGIQKRLQVRRGRHMETADLVAPKWTGMHQHPCHAGQGGLRSVGQGVHGMSVAAVSAVSIDVAEGNKRSSAIRRRL